MFITPDQLIIQKRMKIAHLNSVLFIIALLVLPTIITGQMSEIELKDLVQKSIDSGDWETVSTLIFDEQKRLLEGPTINREEIFSGIAKHSLKKRKSKGLSLFDFGKISTIKNQVNQIEFLGFDSSKLEFIDKNTISDGSIIINLEDLPESTSKVTYTKEDGALLELEKGSSIKYSRGKIDKDLKYTSIQIPSSTEDNGIIQLSPNKGPISIDKNGKFSIGSGANIKVGDRIFERIDTETETASSFSISPTGGQFKGSNIKLTTTSAEIRINSELETEILFNRNKPTTEQFIQLVSVEEDTKNLRIKGKDIEINLLDQGPKIKKISTLAEGKNIKIKNGDEVITIYDGKVNYPRIPKGNTIVYNELNPPQFSNGKIISNPKEATFVEFNEENRVCIGKFCTRFGFGMSNANDIGEGQLSGVHISDTKIYALQEEVDSFKDLAISGRWTDQKIKENGYNHFSQLLEETTYQRAVTEEEATESFAELRTGLEGSDVKGEDLGKIDTIKRSIFSNGAMIIGSVQTTLTFDSGGEKSFGKIIYKDKGETGETKLRVTPIRLPGSQLHNHQQNAYRNLEEFPRGLSEITKQIQEERIE